jgi:hypothetical protein
VDLRFDALAVAAGVLQSIDVVLVEHRYRQKQLSLWVHE